MHDSRDIELCTTLFLYSWELSTKRPYVCSAQIFGSDGYLPLVFESVIQEVLRSCKLRRTREDSYEPSAVDRVNEPYSVFFPEERRSSRSADLLGKKIQLRPEQMSLEGMIVLVSKLRGVAGLVPNTCNGTLATARTCFEFPELCRFVRCEMDSACF